MSDFCRSRREPSKFRRFLTVFSLLLDTTGESLGLLTMMASGSLSFRPRIGKFLMVAKESATCDITRLFYGISVKIVGMIWCQCDGIVDRKNDGLYATLNMYV